MSTEFKINDILSLKLEDGKTNIYVNNKLFKQCKYLLLNIPMSEIETIEKMNSIDEIAEKLDKSLEFTYNKAIGISPETEFWGHCSNLQAWFENNYNTCLIHRNLAFPLLKMLTEAGDEVARRIFKSEIALRFESENLNVVQFLLYNGYLNYLNKEEIECLLDQSAHYLTNNIINELKMLWEKLQNNYWKITNIIDVLLVLALIYNKNIFFQIVEKLPEEIKNEFAKRVILRINYMEFKTYKISYGQFFTFFEKTLDYIYNTCPKIFEFLNLLDTGYVNAIISLDERYSYGSTFLNEISNCIELK